MLANKRGRLGVGANVAALQQCMSAAAVACVQQQQLAWWLPDLAQSTGETREAPPGSQRCPVARHREYEAKDPKQPSEAAVTQGPHALDVLDTL